MSEFGDGAARAMVYPGEVLAVGPFHPELSEHLDYPAKFYAHTKEGMPVIAAVIFVDPETPQELVAAALGVVAADVSTHVIDAHGVDVAKLGLFADDREVEAFQRLRDAGFRFYFWPERPVGDA